MLDLYFSGYPAVKKFFDKTISDSIKNGFISIDSIGRRSYLKDYDKFVWLSHTISRYNGYGWEIPREYMRLYLTIKGEIERTSQNYVIQGEAASITKLAEVLLRKERLRNPIFDIVLSIHDEIILECTNEHAANVRNILQTCMESAAEYFCKRVGIPADAIITDRWNK